MALVILQDSATEGKRAFLAGKGKQDYPYQMNENEAHKFRMGWCEAQSNKVCHPDWDDNMILSTYVS